MYSIENICTSKYASKYSMCDSLFLEAFLYLGNYEKQVIVAARNEGKCNGKNCRDSKRFLAFVRFGFLFIFYYLFILYLVIDSFENT